MQMEQKLDLNTEIGGTEPVGYMERTRRYYRALGYGNDYKWSHYNDVPFTALKKPLAESKATIITTSSPPGGPKDGNRKLKEVWSGSTSETPSDLHTEFLAWDKETTHTRDRESYLPILALQALVAEGRIGSLTEHFHGVPTTYSHRQSHEQDIPEVVRRVQADGADVAFLVPI